MSFSSFNENLRDKLHLKYHNEFKGCTVCCCGAFWELWNGVSLIFQLKLQMKKKERNKSLGLVGNEFSSDLNNTDLHVQLTEAMYKMQHRKIK